MRWTCGKGYVCGLPGGLRNDGAEQGSRFGGRCAALLECRTGHPRSRLHDFFASQPMILLALQVTCQRRCLRPHRHRTPRGASRQCYRQTDRSS